MRNNKGFAPILILVLLAIVGIGAYYLGNLQGKGVPILPGMEQKACTLEAMLCPDGSSVGRAGPNCEFAPCPTPKIQTTDWNLYLNTQLGFSIRYPKSVIGLEGDWEYKEVSPNIVGFRPSSMREDVLWVINMQVDKNLNELIDSIGNQFPSREILKEEIMVAGKEALLVTVIPPQAGEWVAKTVFIFDGERTFMISNGATTRASQEFEQFYKSFKLI